MTDGATSEVTATMEGLGRRYVDLVYGAAVRQMGGEGRGAEDVTQSVFLVAMCKAKSGGLPEEGRMAGWLLKVTKYAVKRARREEWRRKRFEKRAAAAEAVEQEVEVDAVRLVLDEALLKLGDVDREVVVRRYLQGQAVGEVAAAVGMTRNTATQRIGRVLEKLRKILARRGVTMPAGGMVAVLGSEAAIKAPAAVAASISLGTAGASVAAVLIAKGAAAMMKMATLKATALALAALVAVILLAATVGNHMVAAENPAGSAAKPPGTEKLPAPVPGATPTPVASTANAKPSDQLTHIREQIYILRHGVVFLRTAETYAAVRELVSIGKPAVPELCAELDRLDDTHDNAFRTIALTLRIIGDPRAVPALINALPKSPGGGDCQDRIFDRELCDFLNSHRLADQSALAYPKAWIPRAERQIISALNTITHHAVSDRFDYSDHDTDAWHGWWLAHWEDLITQEEANSVLPPEGKDDPVEAAGLARFGPLFPTGPKIRVGPAHEVALDAWGGCDSKAQMDFDTNTISSPLDDGPARFAPHDTDTPPSWASGLDATTITYAEPDRNWLYAHDLEAWRIDNPRWDSIETEIHSGRPLNLGPGGLRNDFVVASEDMRTPDQPDVPPVTFLFITREGGRGIIQILGSYDSTPCVKFRYRMFDDPDHPVPPKKKPAPPAPRPDLAFGPEIKVTLASPQSKDACALDLDTSEKRQAEAGAVEQKPGNPPWLALTAQARDWLLKWHGDVIVQPQGHGQKLWALNTYDMARFDLSPAAWSNVAPAQLVAVFAYKAPEKSGFLSADAPPAKSIIWAFKTREGAIGLLQVLEGSADPQSLTFRYKLVTGLKPADTQPAEGPATKPVAEKAAPTE